MKKWLFTSGTTRGTCTTISPDMETRECVGIDLVLGIVKGNTIEQALEELIQKLNIAQAIPEYVYKSKIIVAYEITDGIQMSIPKISDIKIEEKVSNLFGQPCQWCGKPVSNKGAAQFSHLQKHLRQLMKSNLISKEQCQEIRSTTLSKEMIELLTQHKNLLK